MNNTQPASDSTTRRPNDPATLFPPIPAPARVYVPLATREGEAAPAKPSGTRVAPGDALTDAAPETAHVAISPVSGKIVGTVRVDLLNGHRAAAVEILVDADGATASSSASPSSSSSSSSTTTPAPAPESTDLTTWIDRLRHAGVWAQRHNGPDLLGQLYQALRRPVDTVVCNVLDGEDAVELNLALARAYPLELIAGVRVLARTVKASRRRIAVDADAPRADVTRLGRLIGGDDIGIIPLPNSYPQPDPTLLLYTLFKRRLRPGRLPPEQGVILLDAAAAIAVGRVALSGVGMLDVPLAVRDVRRGRTHLVSAPVGTPLWHVLERLDVDEDALPRIGDALRDLTTNRGAVVSGGELVVHAGYATLSNDPDPCIRCGWCTAACPTRIHPAGLLEATQRDDPALAERYGIESCIECGVCSYVCPSRLPLLGAIRQMRARKRV